MADDEFYVTLPSNSSFDYYPNNTLNDFTTKLFKPIDLAGEWEVALTEISFPHSFYNIVEPFNVVGYSGDGSEANLGSVTIPPGYYDDLDELFSYIQGKMDELGKANIRLLLNSNTQKVKIKLKNRASVHFHPILWSMLGFGHERLDPKLLKIYMLNSQEAKLPIDLHAGMYSLYVYTDIIEDQLVGDAFAPLLRIVHMDKKGPSGDVTTRTYQSPHFVKVRMKHFDTITVRVRRDTGEKIRFQRGKIVAKLCFRPVRAKYFNQHKR